MDRLSELEVFLAVVETGASQPLGGGPAHRSRQSAKPSAHSFLGDLITVLLAPYDETSAFVSRIRVSAPITGVGENAATGIALINRKRFLIKARPPQGRPCARLCVDHSVAARQLMKPP